MAPVARVALAVRRPFLSFSRWRTAGRSPGGGGGISNGKAQTTLAHVLVTGKVATTRGGGFDVDVAGKVTPTNSTATNNFAADLAGGPFNDGTIACTGSSFTGNTVEDPPVASNCAEFAPGSGHGACA